MVVVQLKKAGLKYFMQENGAQFAMTNSQIKFATSYASSLDMGITLCEFVFFSLLCLVLVNDINLSNLNTLKVCTLKTSGS